MLKIAPAVFALALVLALTGSHLAAQQPNSAGASLVVNQNNPAGPGPISANVAGGGALVVDISGPGLAPLALLWGTTQTGAVPLGPPAGTFDLAYPSPTPGFIVNGLAPATLLDLFAVTNGAGQWQLTASVNPNTPIVNFGLQALVVDFAVGFPFFVLTAATDVTVGGYTTSTVTINEPGDDTTYTYHHQVTAFPFYGTTYGRTHIDTNGYLNFGPSIPSEWQTSSALFLSGPPRICPYWSDMHMSSLVISAFGNTSLVPASFVITETIGAMNSGSIAFEWRGSTEAAGTANQWDYRCTIDSLTGRIRFEYGTALGAGATIPGNGNTFALAGISPGGGLSMNTASQDLVFNCPGGGTGVNGCAAFIAATPMDAIFESFDPSTGAFVVDLVAPTFIEFLPVTGFPSVYQMQ